MGKIAVAVGLLALLVGAGAIAYVGWTMPGNVAMPASAHVAMWLGITFSVVIGCGLMALVFYSSRKGYDEPARHLPRDDEQ